MKKTLIALTACVTLLLAGHTTTAQAHPTSTTTTTTTSQAAATSYWRVPYNGDIYAVTPTAIKKLTLTQYVAAGRPAFKTAAASYVKYPWDAQIHAVTFFGASRNMWAWKHLNAQEWTKVGRPTPRIAGWIQSTAYTKTATANTIYAQLPGGVKHALTYAEWVAAGSPTPRILAAPTAYVKYAWDSQIFRVTFNGTARSTWTWKKLTFAEWAAAGQPKPANAGWIKGTDYYKYSTGPTLYAQLPGGVQHALTPAEWAAAQPATYRTINLGPSIASLSIGAGIRQGQYMPYELQGKWCTRIPDPETKKIECENLAAEVDSGESNFFFFGVADKLKDRNGRMPYNFRGCNAIDGPDRCSDDVGASYEYFPPGVQWDCKFAMTTWIYGGLTCPYNYSQYHNVAEARLMHIWHYGSESVHTDSIPMYRVE